jgi:hypothetical protein
MKLALVVAAAAAAAAVTALVASHGTAAPDAPRQLLAGPPAVLVQYGHIRSLNRVGSRYELRFDPAFWLGGVTANRAARSDRVIGPGETVPNDYYIRDEGKRVLTYLIPAGARVTIVTNSAGQGLSSTRITVAELDQILDGKNPKGRAIYDRRNSFGYWARIASDTVRSLDQQYQP